MNIKHSVISYKIAYIICWLKHKLFNTKLNLKIIYSLFKTYLMMTKYFVVKIWNTYIISKV